MSSKQKEERGILRGELTVELFNSDGSVKSRTVTKNLITAVGDQFYAGRAALTSGLPGPITGMKLGTGATTPSKTGAGAALSTYLSDSHQALNSAPAVVAGSATYVTTWGTGKATTVSAITEVVLVNDALANATSPAANTIARALISGVPAKGADETLVVTWTHTLLGA